MRISVALYAALTVLVILVGINIPNVSLSLEPTERHRVTFSSDAYLKVPLDSNFVLVGFATSFLLILGAMLFKLRKREFDTSLRDVFFSLIAGAILVMLISVLPLISGSVDLNASISLPSALPSILFYGAVALLILVFAAVAFSSVGFRRRERGEEESQQAYVERIDRAIYSLKETSDVRMAIINAYREMEKMMRTRGVRDEDYFTPREFRDFAIGKLKLSEEPVDTLISLFEDARYSDHEMSEESRVEAMKALEAIRNELS